MRVRNKNLANSKIVARDGKTYAGDAHGVFEVAQDFGNWLCGTPGWTPYDGADLGEVLSRPANMSAEAHVKKLMAESAKTGKPVRASDQERQAIDGRPDREVTPPSVQSAGPPPPPQLPEVEVPEAGEEGPDLDGKTKAELLAVASDYVVLGYKIEVNNAMTKAEIREAIESALYSDEG